MSISREVPQTGTGRPRLLDEVRNEVRKRHYSIRTEEAYVGWIKRFIRFHGNRHPREMTLKEIEGYLSDLAVKRKVSASTQNQALNALLFLYRDVLGIRLDRPEDVVRAKKSRKLPVVLSREEVRSLMSYLDGAPWIAAMLMYGAGLRLLECLRLRIKDLDFGYRQITVREGKGKKDRVTMLPSAAATRLQHHLEEVRWKYERDLKAGGGYVRLPGGLARKYSGGEWQWVFPA